MKPSLAVLIATFALTALAQNGPIEQTIAGVTVGASTLPDFTARFGDGQDVRGIVVVHPGDSCTLSAYADADQQHDPKFITTVTLTATPQTSKASGPCLNLVTSKKIGLGSSPADVINVYGKPRFDSEKNGLRILRFDNSAVCKHKSGHPITLRSLMIRYDIKDTKIVEISISEGSYACDSLD